MAADPPSLGEAGVLGPLQGDSVTSEQIRAFRESVLRMWIWRTALGQAFLHWFWPSRLGRWITKTFGEAEAPELHGYAYWGPVALLITVTELLGVFAKRLSNAIPWPTISSTVGYIEDIRGAWAVAVVLLIAVAAFYAVSYSGEAKPTGTQPVLRLGFFQLRYGWPLVILMTGITGLLVWLWRRSEPEDVRRFHLGYAIYGAFALFGIAIPMFLLWRDSNRVVFPSLFYTFRQLRTRLPWVATAVVAGLAVLILHLALYPWPNLAREPATFAGLNAFHAKTEATEALKKARHPNENLVYSSQGRGVAQGQDAWYVYFIVVSGKSSTDVSCVVVVTDKTQTLQPGCLGARAGH
jgi:hypothetical protein